MTITTALGLLVIPLVWLIVFGRWAVKAKRFSQTQIDAPLEEFDWRKERRERKQLERTE